MLTVSNVSGRLGANLLFSNVSFTMNSHSHIGLVGPNGAGKSTLLRIITGELKPASGSVSLAAGTRMGYLRQGFAEIPNGTLADILDLAGQGVFLARNQLEAALAAFGDSEIDVDVASQAYELTLDRFDALGGYAVIDETLLWLGRFGLGEIPMDRAVAEMSGGQKTRAGLASLMASRPNLLILDEPTNHLDDDGISWLQQYLTTYSGALLIVSHDRGFLDSVATTILAIDPHTQAIREYSGNYSEYFATREREREDAVESWNRQQLEIERITRDIRMAEQKARTIEKGTIDFAIRKKAAKIARPAVVRKEKLERKLQGEDAAERPQRTWGLALDFGSPVSGSSQVAVLDAVTVVLGDRTILESVSLQIRAQDRIAITGNNGSGKTTLLRMIMGEIRPISGTVRIGPRVKIGYLSQEQTVLDSELTVLQTAMKVVHMSEADLRNELHKFLFGGDLVQARVGHLSYGERSRLMLALLVLQGTSLLLLDEPLNHLDVEARESFEQALVHYRGTILMVLHDRFTISRLATREWRVTNGQVQERLISKGDL